MEKDTIMERSEKSTELFLGGSNCAQSVLLSFADDLGYSKELALKIAAGFGGGMGRQQGTCGAVTGAIMVLGIMEGEKVSDNNELKSGSYSLVGKFVEKFKNDFTTTSCRELTGCDFSTTAGSEKFNTDGVMEKVCAPCVKRAVEIVEEIT